MFALIPNCSTFHGVCGGRVIKIILNIWNDEHKTTGPEV